MIQTGSQAKPSATILPKVYDVDKGVDPNIKPEKHIIKSLVMSVQSHAPTESRDQYYVKSRAG